ncbi:MAG: LysR substrate-binding domain-containing protein [Alphaproteobacteria bacterium]|nr:LysR substrate-binding domain-containing protein [Alphaproteobacteria bacterium]
MKLNLRQLEAFKAVMETGTVSQAAGVLNVSQPAVSKLIANFERAVGFDVFDRAHGRLAPTPEAAILYNVVERAFVSVAQIGQSAIDIRERRHGRLMIGVMPALSTGFIQEVATEFLVDRPRVTLTLDARSSARVIESLAGQQLDLGIVAAGLDHAGVETEFFCRVEAVCVLPSDHRLAKKDVIVPTDLDGEHFISLTMLDRIRPRIDHPFEEAGVRRILRIDTPMAASACAFVAKGAGVAIVDPFSALEARDGRIVIKPFAPAVPLDFVIAYPLHAQRSQLVLDFIVALRRSLRAYPGLPLIETGREERRLESAAP